MTRLSNPAAPWQRLLLIGSLVLLFAISAGIEEPATESCCDEFGQAEGLRVIITPDAWDPAPWGARKEDFQVKVVDGDGNEVKPSTLSTSFSGKRHSVVESAAVDLTTKLLKVKVLAKEGLDPEYVNLLRNIRSSQTANLKFFTLQWVLFLSSLKDHNLDQATVYALYSPGEGLVQVYASRAAGVDESEKGESFLRVHPPIEELFQ